MAKRSLPPHPCSKCGRDHTRPHYGMCPSCSTKSRRHPCADCGDPVSYAATLCNRCHGKQMKAEGHPNWKGGRTLSVNGYWQVKIDDDHPFRCMANAAGYVHEHRLVMAQYLGRPLVAAEVVHHINHDRQDNRRENLMVLTSSQHMALHRAHQLGRPYSP